MDHHRQETQHDASADPPAEPHQDLHVCLACSSDLVYPIDTAKAGSENWTVLLRCPNCDVYRDGIFSERTVHALDSEVDRGRDVLTREYAGLVRLNMTAEIARFSGALKADAILPEDF